MRIEAFVRAAACASVLASCHATVVEPVLAPAWTEADAGHPLTRAECVRLAVESAPTAAAWQARRAAARASLEQAQLLPNPTLGLTWEDFGLNGAAAQYLLQTTLTLAVALEDVFAREHRAGAASHELEAEEAELLAERERLAAAVARAYDGLVAARARIELQRELAAVAETQRAAVERFAAAGIAPRVELERAEAELLGARADVALAEADARLLELEFEFSLGFARPVSLQLAEPLTASTATNARDLAALLAQAADARKEIAAAAARYQAQLERLDLAADRVQFLPVIGGGPREQDSALLGVASIDVVLPLFDTGAAAQHAQEAALLAAAAELRRVAQRTAAEVCAAAERLAAAEAFLAEFARELARRRGVLRERTERLFAAGQVEYSDLMLARRDEVSARIALVDAELAAATARVDLDAAVGK
jgi:cobalt-zinc-cadmium efflux system outer membrane protein